MCEDSLQCLSTCLRTAAVLCSAAIKEVPGGGSCVCVSPRCQVVEVDEKLMGMQQLHYETCLESSTNRVGKFTAFALKV